MAGVSELRDGDVVAHRYRIGAELHRGGQGVLLAAHDQVLGRDVVVKLLPDMREPRRIERLFREARTVARLQSEHIVQVLDMGTHAEMAYIVLERLSGSDLAKLARPGGPLPGARAADYIIQACEGIAHAHAQSIIHRDIKPSNLFLAQRPDGSSVIKIVDFGIAKALREDNVELTEANAFLGSPAFMSPEQIRAPSSVDPRSDVWSLGVVLYLLVSGRRPFPGVNLVDTIRRVCDLDFPLLASIGCIGATDFDRVLTRCLARDREMRYPSVLELAAALTPLAPARASSLERIAFVLGRPLESLASPRETERLLPAHRSVLVVPDSNQVVHLPGFASDAVAEVLPPAVATAPAGPTPARVLALVITALLVVVAGLVIRARVLGTGVSEPGPTATGTTTVNGPPDPDPSEEPAAVETAVPPVTGEGSAAIPAEEPRPSSPRGSAHAVRSASPPRPPPPSKGPTTPPLPRELTGRQ